MGQPNYKYDVEGPIESNTGMVVWKMKKGPHNPLEKKYWVEEGSP